MNSPINKEHDQCPIEIIKLIIEIDNTINLATERPGPLSVAAGGDSWPITHHRYPRCSLLHTELGRRCSVPDNIQFR